MENSHEEDLAISARKSLLIPMVNPELHTFDLKIMKAFINIEVQLSTFGNVDVQHDQGPTIGGQGSTTRAQ